MNFLITWPKSLTSFFTYGETLSFQEGKVQFEHPFLSPGVPIVSWQSQTNYWNSRTLLQLPLLKRGDTYRLVPKLQVSPSDGLVIRLRFYDRTDQLLEQVILESQGGRFTYPFNAYHYEIAFIQTGATRLAFEGMELTDGLKGGEA